MPSPDIILIGAGRHPDTKQRRLRVKPARRNPWIGPVQIKSGVRFPVDQDFVKKHFEAIVQAVKEGVLIVEYKLDKFVAPDELQTLAFGSDSERDTYEKEIADQTAARSSEIDDKAKEKEKAELDARDGDIKAQQDRDPEDSPDGPKGFVNPDNATRLSHGAANPRDPKLYDNTEGSREDPLPKDPNIEVPHQPDLPPQVPLQSLSEIGPDGKLLEGATPDPDQVPESKLEGTPDNAMGEVEYEDPEYKPDLSAPRSVPEGQEYKPLPENWHKATKPELLSLCAERGIDTSDMPSNRVLRERLEKYGQ